MDFISMAEELKDELINIRRQIHQNPEIGDDLPITVELIKSYLNKLGIETNEVCKNGLTATLGEGEKCILLRADMDALNIKEESGLEFSSLNDNCHACGHDIHTTMLLGAANILKKNESRLKGTVKLMFQPAEETIQGAKNMINGGVLENPKVDVALGMHVNISELKSGVIGYTLGETYSSQDKFRITVYGKGSHGANPHLSYDPINTLAHIHIALQEIISREVNPLDNVTLTIGQLISGTADNIIPSEGFMTGTLRTYNDDIRNQIKSRIVEICDNISATFRCKCKVQFYGDVPPLVSNIDLTKKFVSYIKEINYSVVEHKKVMLSEDFACVSQLVPSTFLAIGFGNKEEGYNYGLHNPRVTFNENVIHVGSAIFAQCAFNYLNNVGM